MRILNFDQKFAEYLHDESRRNGTAEYICFPQSEKDIRTAIQFARDNNISLTIQGSRTGITAGAVPDNGLIVNLEKMNRIIALRSDEDGFYYIRCQPGIKLIELRKQLAEKNIDTENWSNESLAAWRKFKNDRKYFFPPDPTETSASIGGMAACNASGAGSFLYGASRNWITDIKMIPEYLNLNEFSKIEISKIDCSLKNASGYFLRKSRRDIDLLIGSEGTLGIISELELKLIPEPYHHIAVMQFFSDETDALMFCRNLRNSEKPAAIEYFSKNAISLIRNNLQLLKELPDLKPHWQYAVYLEFCGDNEEDVEDLAISAAETAEEFNSTEKDSWFVDNHIGIENLKTFRHAVPEAINLKLDKLKKDNKNIAKISTDLVVPEGFLPQMVKLYNQAEKEGFDVIVFGHIGNNHLHTNIIPKNYSEYKKGLKIAKSWAQKAVQSGGSVSGEHGIGKTKKNLLKLMYSPQELSIMQNIKNKIDPDNIFNPHNLF